MVHSFDGYLSLDSKGGKSPMAGLICFMFSLLSGRDVRTNIHRGAGGWPEVESLQFVLESHLEARQWRGSLGGSLLDYHMVPGSSARPWGGGRGGRP